LFFSLKKKIEIVNNLANSGSLKRTELLEKYFIQNPWYDVTNLDEMIKSTGIDDISIKVTFYSYFCLKKYNFFNPLYINSVSLKLKEIQKKVLAYMINIIRVLAVIIVKIITCIIIIIIMKLILI
jgi:hypothetical protein